MEKSKCPMPLEDIKERVLSAIVDLYRYDGDLLDRDANERSITHKLAEHLQRQFPDWNVDCEYNRRENEVKRIPRSDGNNEHTVNGENERGVFPDIIIHERGKRVNLVVIEAKKLNSDPKDKKEDIEKLKVFITNPNYEYCVGLFLEIGTTRESPKLTEYKQGGATEDWTADLSEKLRRLGYGS